jgi:hypothetical protein
MIWFIFNGQPVPLDYQFANITVILWNTLAMRKALLDYGHIFYDYFTTIKAFDASIMIIDVFDLYE